MPSERQRRRSARSGVSPCAVTCGSSVAGTVVEGESCRGSSVAGVAVEGESCRGSNVAGAAVEGESCRAVAEGAESDRVEEAETRAVCSMALGEEAECEAEAVLAVAALVSVAGVGEGEGASQLARDVRSAPSAHVGPT